ncbi:MAG TPA: endonuclease MutS2 [Chloroflexi bacterium]|nr:endonuclease MutS2 [Chloroflexota bacterium]
MHAKHLSTLEFAKVLDRLAGYSDFSGGQDKARALEPATNVHEVRWRLETTSEARALLDAKPETSLGGAHDVRPQVEAAERGVSLSPHDILDVRDTLVSARTLHRHLSRLESQFPNLADIAGRILVDSGLINEINQCLDERGTVRDDASPELARIRREERIAYDRLQDKLQNIISASRNAKYLQEALITRREDRYVIPLKAEFKGRIRGIVHDVSASGATIFIEPLATVDLNNAWRELQLEEQQEIQRILAALSAMIADQALEIRQTLEALADLDLAFAKAKYADDLDASAPEIVPFGRRPAKEKGKRKSSTSSNGAQATVRLLGACHPLLDPKTVVPIDVELDDETHVLVITGPNTGGKTVSLKTIGLLTVMAQAGLHIPVQEGSALSLFESVYADIGDEQSIEQSLSTFSSHLINILSFLDRVDERSLVLLDELGAGTDPAEGAALAHALLEHFRERRSTTFVATHYPELKSYAQLTPGVRNANVEFDPETLSPTYRLSIGLPGRSNAFAIAQRLGTPDAIVEAARDMISPDDLRTEDMLADIHRLRLQAAQARDEAHAARSQADRLTRELRQRLDQIDQERQEVLDQARQEAADELASLRTEVRRLRQRLHAAAAPLESVTAVEEAAASLAKEIEPGEEVEALAATLPRAEPSRPIRSGDAVWVRPLNANGQVLNVDAGEGEAEVQVGPARTRVSLKALELREPSPREAREEPETTPVQHKAPSPGMRLDLRGCTVEEALARLDQHLDAAFRAGLPWVHVIHGKGTGALRRAVGQYLVNHPVVETHELAREREGGAGVTIAKLVNR